jgi:uncharacterized membrane protein YciS (DUF1049 family)
MAHMFEQLDVFWKIGLFSIIFSALIVFVGLMLAGAIMWIKMKLKMLRAFRQFQAQLKADTQAKTIFRLQKEREARRNMVDDEFSRVMWEILKS